MIVGGENWDPHSVVAASTPTPPTPTPPYICGDLGCSSDADCQTGKCGLTDPLDPSSQKVCIDPDTSLIPAVTHDDPVACGVDTLTLSWNSVTGALSYEVRVDDKSTPWGGCGLGKELGDVCADVTDTNHTFSVTAGNTYRYYVRAVFTNTCGPTPTPPCTGGSCESPGY